MSQLLSKKRALESWASRVDGYVTQASKQARRQERKQQAQYQNHFLLRKTASQSVGGDGVHGARGISGFSLKHALSTLSMLIGTSSSTEFTYLALRCENANEVCKQRYCPPLIGSGTADDCVVL